MNRRQFIRDSALSLLALGVGSVARPAWAEAREKCFGIAKAGQNDCAGLSGLHSCKGLSKENYNPGDYRIVPTGTCKKLGGLTESQAKAMLKHPAEVKRFEAQMSKRMAQHQG